MKSKFILLVLLLSTSTMVFAEEVKVDNSRLDSFRQAAKMALAEKGPMTCKTTSGQALTQDETVNSITYVIDNGQGAFVHEDKTQPVLTFSYLRNNERFDVKLTTTANYKSIVSVAYVYFKWVDANSGTLIDPVITKVYRADSWHICN